MKKWQLASCCFRGCMVWLGARLQCILLWSGPLFTLYLHVEPCVLCKIVNMHCVWWETRRIILPSWRLVLHDFVSFSRYRALRSNSFEWLARKKIFKVSYFKMRNILFSAVFSPCFSGLFSVCRQKLTYKNQTVCQSFTFPILTALSSHQLEVV